ncbi:hypothetical protein Tco_1184921 [Tanacetum coccineum]
MIAETYPTQREEALTETGQNSVPVPETALTVCTTRLKGQLHTILEDMDRYQNACLEELEAFITPDAEDSASNCQEARTTEEEGRRHSWKCSELSRVQHRYSLAAAAAVTHRAASISRREQT